MSALKATPGPWLIEKERDGDISIWARKPLPNAIATVLYEDVNGGNPVETNANLIAAAPELYEALEELLGSAFDGPAYDRAVAALAKARGEQVRP